MVVFESAASNLVASDGNGQNIFAHTVSTGTTEMVNVSPSGTPPNQTSYSPSVTKSGRYVAFESYASNLVAGDDIDEDISFETLTNGTTALVSVSTSGMQALGNSYAASISASGRYVSFVSAASNLVSGDTNGFSDVFRRDTVGHKTIRVSVGAGGAQSIGGVEGDDVISPMAASSSSSPMTTTSFRRRIPPTGTCSPEGLYLSGRCP